jgi:hypothetical protein
MAIIERSPSHTPQRRRRIAWLVPVAAVVVATTAAAGWAVLRPEEPAQFAGGFMCVADGTEAGMAYDGTDPIAACQQEWEAGNMVRGVTEAPPLVACLSEGAITVMEGSGPQTCDQAGMAAWSGKNDEDFAAAGEAVRAVQIELWERYDATGNGCATVDDWRERLGEAFEERDLGEWTFDVDQVEPSRHCYQVGEVLSVGRRVVLVGVPDDFSLDCDPRTGC